MCSKLTISTPERRHRRRSDVFIVNFEHISHFLAMFLSLTLNSKCFLGSQYSNQKIDCNKIISAGNLATIILH